MKTTTKDLRIHTKEILSAIARGEEVIVTYRGKPYAKIIPIKSQEEPEQNKLFGIWKDNDLVKDVEKYIRNIREGRFSVN